MAVVCLIITAALFPVWPRVASAAPAKWGWSLPQTLSDENTKITFEVDSTWHLVKGRTSGVTGKVWLADPRDELSVHARFDLPVARFDTDGEMRDERMREVMDSEHVPYVSLSVDSLRPSCDPASFATTQRCPAELAARLTIRGTERPMKLQGTLENRGSEIVLTGDSRFSWLDFGVEDPSILVAKLDPEVVVTYSVSIPTKQKD